MALFSHHPDAKRFTFDTTFEGGQVVTPARPKRAFTPEEVEAVRAEAFAAGERSAVARAEAEAAAAVAAAAAAAREGLGALARIAHDHRAASADLAMAAARKIAGAALDAFPQAPASAAFEALARELEAVPRLLVSTAPGGAEALQAALDRAAQVAGYPGQIVVRADAACAPAAFIFDWGDGRAQFDPETAAARVAEAVDAALAAEGLHGETLIPPPPSSGMET